MKLNPCFVFVPWGFCTFHLIQPPKYLLESYYVLNTVYNAFLMELEFDGLV